MRKFIRQHMAQIKKIRRLLFDLRNARIISKSDLFDKEWYLANNPDVKNAGVNPVFHFLRHGDLEGRSPGPLFNGERYLLANPDVRRSDQNSLLHYLKYGRTERRDFASGNLQVHKKPCIVNTTHGLLVRTRTPEYGPIERVLEFDRIEKIVPRLSVCVHLHLFHTDYAEEIVGYLKNIPVKFSLFVSVQSDVDVEFWRTFFEEKINQLSKCIVKKSRNKGRDVSPWVVLFKEEILKHDIFLHIHSKKSDYDRKYRFWRKYLFHNTLGSAGVGSQIYNIFERDSTVGLVYPAYYGETKAQPAWGANKDAVNELSRNILGISELKNCPDFPGGSFFWCRTAILKPLMEADFRLEDFDEENGQLDGTLAHAIERFMGILGSANGHKKVCVTVDVAYNLTGYWDRSRAARIKKANSSQSLQVKTNPLIKDDYLGGLRVAVCTAVAGNFDELVSLPTVESGVDYFCFTDKSVDVPPPYKNQLTPYIDPNPRKTARFVKTHPHYFFPEYDVVVWIDANVVPLQGILPYVEAVIASDADIGVIRHPVRDGYIEEAGECVRIGADDEEVLNEQIRYYEALGVKNTDLVETNILISRPKHDRVKKFFDTWWREINKRSIRDQISMRYAAFMTGVKEKEIFEDGISTRDEGNFVLFAHDVKGRSSIVDFVINTVRD